MEALWTAALAVRHALLQTRRTTPHPPGHTWPSGSFGVAVYQAQQQFPMMYMTTLFFFFFSFDNVCVCTSRALGLHRRQLRTAAALLS